MGAPAFAPLERTTTMLWLIWIAMMLLVPVIAGVKVWFNIHRKQSDS